MRSEGSRAPDGEKGQKETMKTLVLFVLSASWADGLLSTLQSIPRHRSKLHLRISLPDFFSPQKNQVKSQATSAENEYKLALLDLLSTVPKNVATPKELTSDILEAVKILEKDCPTPESDVLQLLAGNWELIWTAQDLQSSRTSNIFSNWIK
jgi:hypothetical protein